VKLQREGFVKYAGFKSGVKGRGSGGRGEWSQQGNKRRNELFYNFLLAG